MPGNEKAGSIPLSIERRLHVDKDDKERLVGLFDYILDFHFRLLGRDNISDRGSSKSGYANPGLEFAGARARDKTTGT
jgi:hypothetical protein